MPQKNRTSYLKYHKDYYQKNRERLLSQQKEYHKQNAEKRCAYSRAHYRANKNKAAAYRRTPEVRYRFNVGTAIRRGHEWTITFEEYKELMTKACHYCDGYLGKSTAGSGLDRIDNAQGYHFKNVLPCCIVCNRTRGDHFTVAETKAAVEAVINIRKNHK